MHWGRDMARPSKLTPDQWEEIAKRMLSGERAADLAREFGVSKAAISVRVKNRIETVKSVANQLVAANASLNSLSVSDRLLTLNVASELTAMQNHMLKAGVYGAANAHRLHGMASALIEQIDDADPLASMEQVKGAAVLTRLGNEAGDIATSFMTANKDRMKTLDAEDVPNDLGHFYGQ